MGKFQNGEKKEKFQNVLYIATYCLKEKFQNVLKGKFQNVLYIATAAKLKHILNCKLLMWIELFYLLKIEPNYVIKYNS